MGEKIKKLFEALTRNERIVVTIATLVFLITGGVLLAILIQNTTKVVPASGGEYTEGIVGQPVYANPVTAQNESDDVLVKLLFANINDLAEKVELIPNKDNRIWRIRLKENSLWSDDHKLTSDDVIFTIQKIQDPESQSPLFARWQGVVAQRLSELEFQLTLSSPYAFFDNTLKTLSPLPKHLFVDVPVQNWRLSDYNLKPVASGPYTIASVEKQSDGFITDYRLRPNQNYIGDKPFITNFNFHFFTTIEDALTSFNNGQIDGLAGLDIQELERIKRPHKTTYFNIPQYYAVFLNQSKNPILEDASLRRALTLAIDTRALVRDVLQNHGTVMRGPIPEHAASFNTQLPETTYSLDEAMRILDAALWRQNSEGVREKIINKVTSTLEFTLTVPQAPFLKDTAEALKTSWEKVGIKIVLDYQTPQAIARTTLKDRSYEMLLFGNLLAPSSDLLSFWYSSERFAPRRNLSLFNDKRADTLIEKIRQNFDATSRQNQFNELQDLIITSHPAIFLYSPQYFYVTTKSLLGVSKTAIDEPSSRLDDVAHWYLRTARILK